MPAERGYLIVNVAVGFALMLLGVYLSMMILEARLPAVLDFLLLVPLIPFLLFHRWAIPREESLRLDFAYLLIGGYVLGGIPRVLEYFETDRKGLPMHLLMAFAPIWNAVREWLRRKPLGQ